MFDWLQKDKSFPKYGSYWVSVLIPTRGRPLKLAQALRSLHTRSGYSNEVEYLLWVDDDDKDTLKFLAAIKEWDGLPSLKTVVGPRGRGYLDLHVGLNTLASVSLGDWIFCFNDDAEMLTYGWEQMFCGLIVSGDEAYGCPDGICMIIPNTLGRPKSPEFFAIHRKVYEVLGYLGPNMGIDDWLSDIMGKVDRKIFCGLKIFHEDEDDQTFVEGRKSLTEKGIYELTASFQVVRGRITDTLKLMDYIEKRCKGKQ